jgi:hypothetical protein
VVRFIVTSITITINYDSPQSMTKTRSIHYWITNVFYCDVWRTTIHCSLTELPFITSGESNRDHTLQQLVVILLLSRQRVFGELLTSNGRVRCRGNVLQNRCLSNGLPASVRCYSGFQAVFTEPLPSNGQNRHSIYSICPFSVQRIGFRELCGL